MSQSQKLFALIKTMDKSEKRSFRLLSKLHSGGKTPKYVRLFDILDSMKQPDETKLNKKLALLVKSPSSIAHLKNQLYEKLRQSLRYHYDNHKHRSTNLQIKQLLTDVEIFYYRNLFSQAVSLLSQAKALAEKTEKYTALTEIINWEQRLLFRTKIGGWLKAVKQLQKKQIQSLQKASFVADFKARYTILRSIFRQEGFIRENENTTPLSPDLLAEILSNEGADSCIQTQIWHHSTHALYQFISGKMAGSQVHNEQLIRIIDEHPFFLEELGNLYINAITFAAGGYISQRDFEQADFYINKFNSLTPIFIQEKSAVFRQYHTLKLISYIHQGKFEEAVTLIEQIEQKPEWRQNKVSQINFYTLFTVVYFSAEQFEKALHWVNLMLEEKRFKLRTDLISFAHIFNILIHLELDNIFLLEYIIKSAYRFLRTRDRLYKSEALILKYIKKIPKQLNKVSKKQLYTEMRAELLEIGQKIPGEDIYMEYFNLEAWLESKITGTRFASVIQNQVRSGR